MITLNVRGLTNENKRRAIFDNYRNNADFLILQETHSAESDENIWQNEWGGKGIFSHGSTAARGIAIFVKKEFKDNIHNIYRDTEGRYIVMDYSQGETTITIVALYAPNEDSPSFFKKIGTMLRGRQEHKIVTGDFNLTLNVEIDRLNTYCNNNKARSVVADLMEEFYLVDIWRIHNQNKREYSWFKTGNIKKASRIDFTLVSSGLDQKVQATQYLAGIYTDHRVMYVLVELNPFSRGTGYWKLNNSLLSNKDFIDAMNREIEQVIESTKGKEPNERWEIIKTRIGKAAKEFFKEKGVKR